MVSLFNPLIFIEAGVFVVDPALVPEGMSNEFYKITDKKFGFHEVAIRKYYYGDEDGILMEKNIM